MPSFTLIAKDPVAWRAVQVWVNLSKEIDLHSDHRDTAQSIVAAMRAWPNRKTPD